jgi:hypothetical protein
LQETGIVFIIPVPISISFTSYKTEEQEGSSNAQHKSLTIDTDCSGLHVIKMHILYLNVFTLRYVTTGEIHWKQFPGAVLF